MMKSLKRSGLLLTNQELKVLNLRGTGMTAQQMANSLYLGKRTIDFHMFNAYKKLQAKNLMQAIRAAGKLGLIE